MIIERLEKSWFRNKKSNKNLINTLRLKQKYIENTNRKKKQKQRQRIDKEINRLIREAIAESNRISGKNQEKFFNSHLKQNLSLKIFKKIKDVFLGP